MIPAQVVAADLHPLRPALSFSSVNRQGCVGYAPDLQRHHLLPRQALSQAGLGRMFDALDPKAVGFHDFRRNGILLPARTSAATRTGLPLHCGPHRDYNRMVIDRLGRIEMAWSRHCQGDSDAPRREALMRLAILQRALRRRILDTRRPVRFNRNDPLGAGKDFTLLDRMAEELWLATG